MKKFLLSLMAMAISSTALFAISPDEPVTMSRIYFAVGDNSYQMTLDAGAYRYSLPEMAKGEKFSLERRTVTLDSPDQVVTDEDFANGNLTYLNPRNGNTVVPVNAKEIIELLPQSTRTYYTLDVDAVEPVFAVEYVAEMNVYLLSVRDANAPAAPDPGANPWQVVIDGVAKDMEYDGELDALDNAIFRLYVDKVAKGQTFCFRHNGQDFVNDNATINVNSYSPSYLWAGNTPMMSLSADAKDVWFVLTDNPDYEYTYFEVLGTLEGSPVPPPVVTEDPWILTVNGVDYELRTTMPHYYVRTLDEVQAGASFTIRHGDTYWGIQEPVVVNQETATDMVSSDTPIVMTISHAYTDARFQVFYDPDYNEFTLSVNGDFFSAVNTLPSDAPDADVPVKYYTIDGRPTTPAAPGLYIKLTPAGPTKVLLP